MIATSDRPFPGCLQASPDLADAAAEALRAVDHIAAEAQPRPDDSLTALMIAVQDGL